MIAIIDYGMGNLHSVKNALDNLFIDSEIIVNPKELFHYKSAILPGVGSFKKAMQNLEEYNWANEIINYSRERPLLGICLGMQLLFSLSYEGGKCEGLGIFEGEVNKIQTNLALPHVGWNSLSIKKNGNILDKVNQEIDVYFVHSYECIPSDSNDIICTVDYGKEIVAGVSKDNLFGLQFHPEKSHPSGLIMLENFFKLST